MVGVIFDGAGEALPPEHLAQQLGCQAGDTDAITYAVRTLGFVHVAPIRDALLVKFDPSTVLHLAALAALYKIVAQAPKRLVLVYPGQEGGLDQYQIFNSLISGLKRVEAALSSSEGGIEPPQPSAGFPTDRRFCELLGEQVSNRKPPVAISGVAVKTQAGDYSERLWKPLDSIAAEDKWLGQLLSIWRTARQGSRLPACESIDPLEVLTRIQRMTRRL
jgi:hypothetical protein